jgi:fluoroacetyl-CoA thioesterase
MHEEKSPLGKPRAYPVSLASGEPHLVRLSLFGFGLSKLGGAILNELTTGLSAEISVIVTESDTAAKWGSGLVPVLGTPALVGLMEAAAVKALDGHLPEGQTTVGGHIDVHHLAATPVGMKVRALAELAAMDDRKLTFQIEAWDEVEKIGEAMHERFVIDKEKFIAKTQAKSKSK